MPHIISKEQKSFINGRSIKDYICLAPESISVMNKKIFGANVPLKIDISKALTLSVDNFCSRSSTTLDLEINLSLDTHHPSILFPFHFHSW